MTNSFPGYVFNRKTYKSVDGLCKALAKDSGASEISCVSSDRKIKAWANHDHTMACAVYSVTPPKVGQPMFVTREA